MKNVERTMKYLREKGWIVDKVERWIPRAKKRIDLFGIFDLAGMSPEPTKFICGIQVCQYSDWAAHRKTIIDSQNAKEWIDRGGEIMLIAWKKMKTQSRKKWMSKVLFFVKEDFLNHEI